MTQIHPGIMRHAFFGDEADSNKIYMVPEHEVSVTIVKTSSGTKLTAKFKGHVVTLPVGSAVQFVQVQAITASGGIGFPDPEKAPPPASISRLHIPVGKA